MESSGLGRYALLSGQTIRLPESLDEEGQVGGEWCSKEEEEEEELCCR